MSDGPNIQVSVGIQVVVHQNDKILLGQRQNMFHSGSWGLPGGQLNLHLEPGETLLEVGARKLYQETGLIAMDVELICITDPTPESNYHMQIGILVSNFKGTLTIREPDYCSTLDFFSIDKLPQSIFVGSVDVIKNYIEGKFYRGRYTSIKENETYNKV